MKIGYLVPVVFPNGWNFKLIDDEQISRYRLANERGTGGVNGFCGVIEGGK